MCFVARALGTGSSILQSSLYYTQSREERNLLLDFFFSRLLYLYIYISGARVFKLNRSSAQRLFIYISQQQFVVSKLSEFAAAIIMSQQVSRLVSQHQHQQCGVNVQMRKRSRANLRAVV